MAKFEKGDEAIVKKSKPEYTTLRKGQTVVIKRLLDHGSFEVADNKGNTWWLHPSKLAKKPNKKGGS